MIHTIIWRRIDKPGHDYCRLVESPTGARMSGIALLSHENVPTYIGYDVECDVMWQTLRCSVKASVGEQRVDLDVRRQGKRWTVNGREAQTVEGAEDIDLGFTPATNLLPLRRLALKAGESAVVRAAWVRFPEFTLELLEQNYTRLDDDTYRYESAGGGAGGGGTFRRDLKVDASGLVLDYPGLWSAESHTVDKSK